MISKEICFNNKKVYDIDPLPLYKGQFSELFMAIDRSLKRRVILKIVENTGNIAQIEREVVVCSKLSNYTSQIPVIFDYKYEKQYVYIVMQWIPGNDLSYYLSSGISDKKKLKYARDLCSVLSILHRNKFEHRDLKPENIRISTDDRVYLIDFNISSTKRHRGEGTDNYRAPENDLNYAIKGNGAMDVFSVGVILYQMFTNHLPLPFIDYVGDYTDTTWQYFKEPKEYNDKINESLNKLIVKCMMLNPRDRYQNANQIYYELSRVRI